MSVQEQQKGRLNGYALYVVLMVAVLIALFSSAFILVTFYYKSVEDKVQLERKLIANANSGIEYLLSTDDSERGSFDQKNYLDLFDQEEDSVQLSITPWGLFQYLSATAVHGSQQFSVTHLAGAKTYNRDLALYLSNSNKELGVTGNTRIKGNVLLPEKGVARAYVEGKNFSGRQLIEGDKGIAGSVLPTINDFQLSALKSYFSGAFPFDVKINWEDFLEEKRNEQPMLIPKDSTVLLFSEEVIQLNTENAKKVNNKCIIQSNKAIHLSSSNLVSNCILIAPYIELSGTVKKGVQLFAQDSIVIQDGAELLFPTVLAIHSTEKNAQIKVGKNAKVFGSIIALQDQFRLKNNSLILIKEKSLITGQIYAQGYLQLHNSKVKGQVFANKLILKTKSSVYENLLMDVEITPQELDSLYSGLLFKENRGKAIIE